jgi:hypothetical protein
MQVLAKNGGPKGLEVIDKLLNRWGKLRNR